MAAQVIFHYRCEPTQVETTISPGNHKSGFAVTVLRCDFLHHIHGGKCGKEAYTGGIACEQFAREGIDMVIRNGHGHQNITGKTRSLDALSACIVGIALIERCLTARQRALSVLVILAQGLINR